MIPLAFWFLRPPALRRTWRDVGQIGRSSTDCNERSSGGHAAFWVVVDNRESGSGVYPEGMTVLPQMNKAAGQGRVEVFGLLRWYIHCVPSMPSA